MAYLEGVDPEKTAAIVLFHDNGEFRIGDQNIVTAKYLDKKDGERKAMREHLDQLPQELRDRMLSMFDEFEDRSTLEGVVAKDADWLENAITAKELVEQGYVGAQNWIDNVSSALETKSARELLGYIKDQEDFTNSWWRGLKKMTNKKLISK